MSMTDILTYAMLTVLNRPRLHCSLLGAVAFNSKGGNQIKNGTKGTDLCWGVKVSNNRSNTRDGYCQKKVYCDILQ